MADDFFQVSVLNVLLRRRCRGKIRGAGKTALTLSVSVNVLSAYFPFCVVPAGREGGGNGKYVDISGKR